MGGLDVIMIIDFNQDLLVWNSWIFKSRIEKLNIIGTNFSQ
jgi:hypothetical protein